MSAGRDGTSTSRRIVGNLDCESDFAAAAPGHGHPGPLPGRVRETIAGAATLLRVFARDGDRLWLPAPVEAGSMVEVPGLPRPILESGPLNELSAAGELLAWGETAAVTRARPCGSRADVRLPDGRRPAEAPLHDLVWRWPPPAPAAAAAVNDRAFCLALADKLGCRLPGARMIASPRELEEHLATGGAQAATGASWVLKAPFSAAGRWRRIHRGGARDGEPRSIERIFDRHGPLLFEPWMDRTADFGCAAAVTPDGIRQISFHRLRVDGSGRFTGVELRAGDVGLQNPWLTPREQALLERVLEGVSAALGRARYRGPFGVDCWRYRHADGHTAFHPLGEINGRMTFGLVARALAERLREPLDLTPGTLVRLAFGGSPEHGARQLPLLRSAAGDRREIRLEILPPATTTAP